MIKIKEQEIIKRKAEICKGCKHKLSFHIFWNDKGFLELTNCNECFCKGFRKPDEDTKLGEKGK